MASVQSRPDRTGDNQPPRSIDALAAAQGVLTAQNLDALIGRGASLWADDREFGEFLSGIDRRSGEGVACESNAENEDSSD